jgi:hypothetical protein
MKMSLCLEGIQDRLTQRLNIETLGECCKNVLQRNNVVEIPGIVEGLIRSIKTDQGFFQAKSSGNLQERTFSF